MNFTVTTLSENTVPQGATGLIGEHGQSFYIECGEHRILFDTGQGLALVSNAEALGIDLKAVDTVILSHGHNDHSGGIGALLEVNSDFALIAHPDAFSTKLVLTDGEKLSRGVPVAADVIKQKGITLQLESHPVQIGPNIQTTGEIPLTVDFESVGSTFFTELEGRKISDGLLDDQALILNTGKGTVVLLGCTHRGLINTLNQVVALTGKRDVHAVIGGLHLGRASQDRINQMIDCLHQYNVKRFCIGHCNGIHALRSLMDAYPDRVTINAVGNRLSF